MPSAVILPNHVFTGRLSKAIKAVNQYLCTFFNQKLTTAYLESAEERECCRKYFFINLHKKMLPDLAGIDSGHELDVHPTEPLRSASRGDIWMSKTGRVDILICDKVS